MKEKIQKIILETNPDWEIINYKEEKFIKITIAGGENDFGKLSNYTSDINSLACKLEKEFSDVWLIKWENDVLDDIWYLELGIEI